MATSRRTVLKLGGLGAAAAVGALVPLSGSVSSKSISTLRDRYFPVPYRARLPVQRPIAPDPGTTNVYTITQRASTASLVSGFSTQIYAYNGIFPGPMISVEHGQPVQVRMRNQLPPLHPMHGHTFATSTHLHGSASLPQYDGYANDLTLPGQVKTYHYPNSQRARTLWYHDHAVHNTAKNDYSGLAAQYLIHDPVERELLPQGDFDVSLTVNDVFFTSNGQLGYDDDEHSGLWGDVIMVNGQPWPYLEVQPKIYRFRLLNASLSRSYRFRLSNGAPVHMVATDGGLMAKPQAVTSWRHAPAERYEFLIDFRSYAPGTQIRLLNDSNKNNVDYDHTNKVMRFHVVPASSDTSPGSRTLAGVPDVLDESDVMHLRPQQATKERHFRLKHDDITNEWSIDGKTWHDVVESNFTDVLADPGLNDVEIWEWENSSGGWFHPLHIHLVDFKILSRNGRAPFAYELGAKDVVYVGEGETVRLLMQFGPHRGRYMVHCHNLPHEDHDMMHQFSVGWDDGDPDPNHPVNAAPAQPDV